jgi:hypothetical protein
MGTRRLPGPTEAELLKQVIAYLRLRGWFAWRNGTGAFPLQSEGSKRRFFRAGAPGSGDVFAIKAGVFLSIEVKTATGRVRPSQADWMDRVNEHGGVAFVVRSIAGLEEALATLDSGRGG